MSLPISIDNVSYYRNKSFASTLAVKCFTGDLLITKEFIYFVPHTLGKYAPKGTTDLGLAGAVIAEAQITTTNRSRLHQNGLWQPEDTSETLQKKLDAYISNLKKSLGRPEIQQLNNMNNLKWLFWMLLHRSESYVPCPIRFGPHEIKALSLSATGSLTFEAQATTHTFKTGLTRKGTLRDALWEALHQKV